MSINSCLAGGGRLQSLTQAVGAGESPGASSWQGVFEVFTADPLTLATFVIGSVVSGVGLYLLVATFFHYRYYKGMAAQAGQWKCQPQRLPTARMWRIDLWLGIFNMSLGSLLSGLLAYWIYASGRSPVYFSLHGHGLLELIVGSLFYYLVTDLIIYWAHRLYHRPALFRLIHRYHHRNTTPTAFTAFALHPVEFLTYQSVMLIPLLFVPLNAFVVIAILVSAHLEAMVQHSGVRVSPWIPWMPNTYFHDDHHRFFHVNYGQHLTIWDRMYGSLRRYGRRYGVEVFGGEGAPAGVTRSQVRFVDYGRKSGLRGDPAATEAPSPTLG